jgi:predicted nucleic acid-binding protein
MAVQLGWLDTNVFIHSLYRGDREHARSRALVEALADGWAEGWLSPLVVHELTYTLARRPQFSTRAAVHTYLLEILNAPGVRVEDDLALRGALGRWAAGATIGFVDAYLAELAQRDGLPVCSANARDFAATPNSYAMAAL